MLKVLISKDKCIKMNRIFIYLLCIPVQLLAQLSDSFQDGDFIYYPSWTGCDTVFMVNNEYQLQLDDDKEGMAWLTTAHRIEDDMEWRIWVKQKFSPSGNNFSRIYLWSDNSNLSSPLKGYFIQLGESGSNDAVELFSQQGGNITSICRGTNALVSSSFIISIKAVCSNGNWKLYVDPTGGSYYEWEASGYEPIQVMNGYFGFYCQYTVSNSSKFYFDDVYAGAQTQDTSPPEIISVTGVSPKDIEVEFSEYIVRVSAENELNYRINNSQNPLFVILSDENPQIAKLSLENELYNSTNHILEIKEIDDLSGNIMNDTLITFTYYKAEEYDVVINEIMADPTPSVGIPEIEYLELYNNSAYTVNLQNWSIGINNNEVILPNFEIGSGEYLILTKEGNEILFELFGLSIGISSLSLPNSGAMIKLKNNMGNNIHSIEYLASWVDNDKSDGGWSLEMINPDNPCLIKENWLSSTDGNGGTPGQQNSVFDNTGCDLYIENICSIDHQHFEVYFSQMMDSLSILNTGLYMIDEHFLFPDTVWIDSDNCQSIILQFATPLQVGNQYELSLNDTVMNCNFTQWNASATFVFGIPDSACENDIIINEILFHPLTGCSEFIELYNRSKRIINIAGYALEYVRQTPPDPPDTIFTSMNLGNDCLNLFPDDYLVLSDDISGVHSCYYTENPEAFIELQDFPELKNSDGTIILKDQYSNRVNQLYYNEDMHFPLLNFTDGVSLERINPNRSSYDPTNWHSASENSGFGTPGYQNSQYLQIETDDTEISLNPKVFFPGKFCEEANNVNINYKLSKAGTMASIIIFDENGFPIRQLINNEMLGTSGAFSWDGVDDGGNLVYAGMYVIFVEIFSMDGEVRRFREVVGVGR